MIKDTDMLFFILFSLFATIKGLVPSWDTCRSLFGGHLLRSGGNNSDNGLFSDINTI